MLLDGELLAETRRASALFETSLPPRYYISIARTSATSCSEPSSTRTRCAVQGHRRPTGRCEVRTTASYDDLVWSYRDPELEAEPIRDLLCFFNERVDLELDGELVDRPRTQWSRDEAAVS